MTNITRITDKRSPLEEANDKLMVAWDLAIVLRGYLAGELAGADISGGAAATVAAEIERRIGDAYGVTADLKS